MPDKSAPQQRLMRAAAHIPGGYGGVPQSVGRDFVNADKKQGVRFDSGGRVSGAGDTGSAKARSNESTREAFGSDAISHANPEYKPLLTDLKKNLQFYPTSRYNTAPGYAEGGVVRCDHPSKQLSRKEC